MRKLVLPLALACAGLQVAPGSALLAGLLALGIHRGDHAHAVAIVADQGHLHLVLSHGETGDHEHARAPQHDHRQTSPSETDHVLHIAGDDATNTTPRRVDTPPASPPAVVLAALPSAVPAWVVRLSPDAHARSSDPLRTVVLRL